MDERAYVNAKENLRLSDKIKRGRTGQEIWLKVTLEILDWIGLFNNPFIHDPT